MLASSVVANYVLTIPTVLIEFLCARTIFHVTHFGDLVSAFLLITIGTVSFASMGLVVASVTNTMQETQVINQLIWLPLIFLSGATVPLASLPQVVKHVASFFPPLISSLASKALSTGLCSLESGCFARARLARRLGRPHILFVCPALPLGARVQDSAEPSCSPPHRNPLSPSGDLGKQYQPDHIAGASDV